MDIHLLTSPDEQKGFQLAWYRDGLIFEDNEIFIYRYSTRTWVRTYVAKKYGKGRGRDIFYFEGNYPDISPEEVKVYLTFI